MDLKIISTILPGALQGLTITFVGHPFDTVKTRLQANIYSNTLSCIKYTYKYEGISGFYRGISVPLLSHIIKRSYQFPMFNHLTQNYSINPYFAGFLTGSSGTLLGNPLQVVKVNTEATSCSTYKNSYSFIKHYYSSKGLCGFYSGFRINSLKDGLFAASFLGNYQLFRSYFDDIWYYHFISGGLSHSISWALFIPLDHIKTQIQKENSNHTISSVLQNIHHKRNYFVLWRGIVPAITRIFPVSGIGMIVYEFCSYALKNSQ